MSVPIPKYPAPALARSASPISVHAAAARRSALSTPLTVLIVSALTLVAAFLRLWNSAGQSFRLDEGFTVNYAALPLSPVMRGHTVLVKSLWQATAGDVHPPGYLLLMHFWMMAFGANLAALRLPGEIAGTVAVPALFALASSLYDRRVGIYAMVLGAFSPFWIWHAQEARMYEFLLLFTIVSTYGFVQALKYRHSWGWAVYFVASLLAVYTQYFAFLVLFPQALFLVTHLREFARRQVVMWVLVNVILAVAFLPWLRTFLTYYHGASDPSLQAPNLYTPLTILSEFLFGYLSVPITSAVVAAWPLLVPVSLALGIFAGAVTRRAVLLWMLFLVPVSTAFVVTFLYKPFVSERYLIVCTPGLFILLAVVLTRLPSKVLRLGIAVLTTAALILSWRVEETSAGNPMTEDYRTVSSYIETHARPGDVVALDSFFNSEAYSYNVHDNLPLYDLPLSPRNNGTVPQLTTARLARYLRGIEAGRKRLWVVYYLESNYDPSNLVRHYLAYNTESSQVIYGGPYQRNQTRYPESFRSVQLILYRLIPRFAAQEQLRPMSTQERRALTGVSPTLRHPFASPFAAPGSTARMLGEPLAIPRPTKIWVLPAPGHPIAHQHLVVFNPNGSSVVVNVGFAPTGPSGTLRFRVPGKHEMDIRLTGPDASYGVSPLGVQTSAPIVPYRVGRWNGTIQTWYGYPQKPSHRYGAATK